MKMLFPNMKKDTAIVENIEQYPTNPSEFDPQYIYDWDDYIEDQKVESLKDNSEDYLTTIFTR